MSEHGPTRFAPGPGDVVYEMMDLKLGGEHQRRFIYPGLGEGTIGDFRVPEAQGLEAGSLYVDYFPADVGVKPKGRRREQWFVAADYADHDDQRAILFHKFIGEKHFLEPEESWQIILQMNEHDLRKLFAEQTSVASIGNIVSRIAFT